MTYYLFWSVWMLLGFVLAVCFGRLVLRVLRSILLALHNIAAILKASL